VLIVKTPLMLPACNFAGVYGVRGDRPHLFNGAKYTGLVYLEAPLFAQSLYGKALLPQADRGEPQIPVSNVVIDTVWSEQVNPAQVARIASKDHLIRLANPSAEDVGPIGNVVQSYAIASAESRSKNAGDLRPQRARPGRV
jgi:hypothetical protein